MSSLSVRQAVRGLLRRPVFTITAVLSLALGIGANVTVLSVVNALLVKPLPWREPADLVAIWPAQPFANREIEALRTRTHSYEAVASLSPGWLMALTGVPVPRQLTGARVSGNLFAMLGTEPALGRAFGMEAEVPGDDGVVVLSWEAWQALFGADRTILGRSLTLDRRAYTVTGVMPRGYHPVGNISDLWTPMTMDQSAMSWAGATTLGYGRLRPGVTPETASAELRSLASALQKEFDLPPSWNQGAAVTGLQASLTGSTRPTLLVLFAAVAFLLAVASANVASLLLVRNAERRHELAVRTSLGARPRDIAGFLAAESVALGITGGVLGMGLAYAGVGLLRGILPSSLPRVEEIAVDARMWVAGGALCLVTTLLFGLAPTLFARGSALADRMRAGRTIAGQGARTRGTMVAIEVALALVLCIGAALMGRTLVELNRVDPGLRTDHLLTMKLQPSIVAPGSNPGAMPPDDALRAYWRTVLDRVTALPGVTSAATVLHLPASGRKWMGAVTVEGRPLNPGESPARTAWQSVSPKYFQTAGIPLLRGRPFTDFDGPQVPRVMAVNQAFVDQVFPGADPLGKRVRAGNGTQNDWATIVAVVGNVRHDSLNAAAGPEIYVPFAQRTVVATALMLRTAGDPLSVAAEARAAIWGVDPNVPISDVRTMQDLYASSLSRQRMILVLLGLFAGMGLCLSAVGTYGVVAYGVRQRVREIGIRMALGADASLVRRLVMGQGVRYAAAGVLVGVPVALAVSRLMRAMVFGVATTDWLTFTLVPLLLVLVSAAASWIPARRAAAGNPTDVLRE